MSDTTSSFPTPSTSPAFQQLSDTNHGPWVVVAAYIFILLSIITVWIKVWTRYQTTRKIVFNDAFILLSLMFACAQTITITISVNHGLGQHASDLSASNYAIYEKSYLASNILLILALVFAKLSVIFLVISIKPLRGVLIACYATSGVVGLWGLTSVLALAFQCKLPATWSTNPAQCVDQYALQLGIGAVNIITDIVIIILPILMMWRVQVNAGKRFVVCALFGIRIITPGFAVAALVFMQKQFKSIPLDPSWNTTIPAIWVQTMMNVSILTACIPAIKRFLADIQSGLMGVNISEPYELTHSAGKDTRAGYGTQTGTRLGTRLATRFGLTGNRTMNGSAMRSKIDTRDGDSDDLKFGYVGGVRHGNATATTMERSESVKGLTDDVILQTIDYKVEYEDNNTEANSEGRSSASHKASWQGADLGDRANHGTSGGKYDLPIMR